MRTEHLLSQIKASTIPEHIIFVDTETTQTATIEGKVYHNLRLGVAIYVHYRRDGKANQKETYRFKTAKEFWSIVNARCYKKTVLYLVSHNAVFDFVVLEHMGNLARLGFECQFVYEGGMRFISKWRQGKRTIMVLDNANWFAGKLARWGDELNLPKLTMPKNLAGDALWFTYCERDTEILYQLFMWYVRFLQDNDLGKWKFTIASSAMNAYRHRFMFHPIYIPDEAADSDIARESYHGGRTECFRVGEFTNSPYYKLDINSMYPFVMREHLYPTCFEGRYTDVSISKLDHTLRKNCVIAKVKLNTNEPYFCYRINNRNVYPVGEFTTTLTTEELRLALSRGWIVNILEAVVYRARHVFREYVDFFFALKQQAGKESKRLLRAFAKLYLNSLYGKFGQRGFVDTEIGKDSEECFRVSHGYNVDTGARFTLRQIGHTVLYSEKGGESYNSFCAVASHVTGAARVLLYKAILTAKRKNVFYCDTDSIICNAAGYHHLLDSIDDNTIGAWKVEGVSNEIAIVAPKHYLFDGKWTMKGVRKTAQQIGPNQYKQEIWPGYNVILKSGEEKFFNYQQTKTLSPSIISGQVDVAGFVRPFRLGKGLA